MERETYKEQGIDMRKIFMRFTQKIWIPIVVTILGMFAAAGIYEIAYMVQNGPMYQSESKIYLDFAPDDTGDVYHQYYNGYTWNDLMTTDPILGKTMDYLVQAGVNVERSVVAVSTKATILSDVRLLTINITNADESLCGQIQSATEQALVTYGSENDLFRGIRVIKTEIPKRLYTDYRMKQAVLLGFVLALLISVFVLWGYLILDDRLFSPSDIFSCQQGQFLGMTMFDRSQVDEQEKQSLKGTPYAWSLAELLEKSIVARSEARPVVQVKAEDFLPDKEGKIRVNQEIHFSDKDFVVVQATFGKTTSRVLEFAVHQLQVLGVKNVGISLIQVEEKWIQRYYRWEKLL